ncbi:MAG: hypothetical protein ACR2LS_00150 [Thermomicrobiales bacterium]
MVSQDDAPVSVDQVIFVRPEPAPDERDALLAVLAVYDIDAGTGDPVEGEGSRWAMSGRIAAQGGLSRLWRRGTEIPSRWRA